MLGVFFVQIVELILKINFLLVLSWLNPKNVKIFKKNKRMYKITY